VRSDEIILFKSVGAAIEDLAASKLVIEAVAAQGAGRFQDGVTK
jgi:ornithine cyclodeaminase/alanine dehydrogenase-like protein (mu-crystallin family)